MEHSKGPWYVTEGRVVRNAGRKTVARAHLLGLNGEGDPEANARLISAAPGFLLSLPLRYPSRCCSETLS